MNDKITVNNCYLRNKSLLEDVFEDSKMATDHLFHFDQVVLREALEEAFPGSTKEFWVQGAIQFTSVVPVITNISNKDKCIKILVDTYQVDKSKVKFLNIEDYKLKKDLDRPRQDYYRPYITVERLMFEVDWHDTTQPDLVAYRDYIRGSMKQQGIQWESQLLEGISEPQRKKLEEYIYRSFLYDDFGLAKMSKNLVDIKVGNDYLDIVFDFNNPTGTEVEVTDKRIDKVVTEHLVDGFFKDNKHVPYFKIIADEHRWLDNNALACFYNIVQYNEKK